MLSASQLKAFLRANGLRLTKRLGQNHLIDSRAVARITQACDLYSNDRVIEIGAGLGALTEALAAHAAYVCAIEIDRGIFEQLRQRMSGFPNVEALCADIREFRWPAEGPFSVVGAVPYSITSDIILGLCEIRSRVSKAVLVVQKEVGQRLTAAPGTKAYGRLSLLGQHAWDIGEAIAAPGLEVV
jgi:16S rRNA (adenine1518-N6/adenine1519-N6)-dimethyltransferase